MTVVALLADPPRRTDELAALEAAGILTADEATECYRAMVADAMAAVASSGGELLVNYPPADEFDGEADPESELRSLAETVLGDVEDVRFEVQVGSTEAARVGNTITHLLETENADTAAILRPEAPLIDRTTIDGAAMKLRRDEVVLGPAPDGRVYYAGFHDPIDFEGALADPSVVTLTERAAEADLGVEFTDVQPIGDRPDGFETLRTLLRARTTAGREVPDRTAAVVEALDAAE